MRRKNTPGHYQSVWKIFLMLLFVGCQTNPEKTTSINMLTNESRKDPRYSDHIRNSDHQTPEEERQDFVLPPGFKVTLFASEPDISKPMDMAFDHKGRLWVTQSSEYPFPAKDGNGRDKITILEDSDGDGKADKFTDFAHDLNIPIGILPIGDGAIAYSIPYIYHLSDQNSTGYSETKQIMFGPFGHKDTHGMINHFKRGFDGWVYGCHGYSNTSTVAGTDGDSISMTSGNTYRFRLDGSRIEHNTFGQVNPFGLAYDKWGYLYSVDCHSRPLYQLIPQGDYPSFGKKPSVIGFAPEMMDHNLGSTALAGLVYYTGSQFPEEYRDCFYTGDVVTCRIDRTGMEYSGSSPVSVDKEPLLVSKDPWFRPVDIEMGPDGALYIADFYNSIIGHYEVSLDHKSRDRTSGRIWRISYENPEGETSPIDLTEMSQEEVLTLLGHSDLQIRMNASDYLIDNWGKDAASGIREGLFSQAEQPETSVQKLWILQRLGVLDNKLIDRALSHSDPLVKTHSIRIIKERGHLTGPLLRHLYFLLSDPSPHVKRAVIETLSAYPQLSHLNPFIDTYRKSPDTDTHLRYVILLGLQKCLEDWETMFKMANDGWLEEEFLVLLKPILDVPSYEGARFIYHYLENHDVDPKMDDMISKYIAANAKEEDLDGWIIRMKRRYLPKPVMAVTIAREMDEGFKIGNQPKPTKFVEWEKALVSKLLQGNHVDQYRIEEEGGVKDQYKMNLIWAIDKTGDYKMEDLRSVLEAELADNNNDVDVRAASANALIQIFPNIYNTELLELFESVNTPDSFKVQLVNPIFRLKKDEFMSAFRSQMERGSRGVQMAIAQQLGSDPEGVDLLLTLVEEEIIRLDLLQEKQIQSSIQAVVSLKQKERLDKLTEKYGDGLKERANMVKDRISQFREDSKQVDAGRKLFQKQCMICHAIAGEGASIGPQLDAIGTRGSDGLIQKILDPNGNISQAFRTYQIVLKDGSQKTGLLRRQEGDLKIFADATGHEFQVSVQDIESQDPTPYTLMPDGFNTVFDRPELNALVNYLLTVK